MKKVVLLTLVGISAMFATACQDSNEVQPKDEIWYTSKDGTIVEPCRGADSVGPAFCALPRSEQLR